MNIAKLFLFTALNCLGTSIAFGAQAPEHEIVQGPLDSKHGLDLETLATIKDATKSFEKTAEIVKKAVQGAKVQSSFAMSSETSVRLTGMGITLMATAAILHSGEATVVNSTALSGGLVMLFGARNIGNVIDYQQDED